MRVTFNSFHDESLANLSRQSTQQARLQVQISSGQRISRPDDDPLTAQKILVLQSSTAQAHQFYLNAGRALDINRSSYNAIDGVRQVSDRAGEIASGVSALTTPETYAANAEEVNGLIEQAISSANQKFDGKYLLSGTKTDTAPFAVARDATGNVTSVTYAGAAQGPSMQVAQGSSVSPYSDGASNTEIGDFINQLVTLRDSLKGQDAAAVQTQRPNLQTSEESILGTLGKLGSQQGRLQMSQDSASAGYDDAVGRIGSYNDVNLPQAMVDLTKSQTAYQAGLQATAKIMSHSLLDYL